MFQLAIDYERLTRQAQAIDLYRSSGPSQFSSEQREASPRSAQGAGPAKGEETGRGCSLQRCKTAVLATEALQARHAQRVEAEVVGAWLQQFEALKAERDALAAELREQDPELRQRILGLLERVKRIDARIRELFIERPVAAGRFSMVGVELAARDRDRFSLASPSVCERVALPELEIADVAEAAVE